MSVHHVGYCAPTSGPGDCDAGDSGSWSVRVSGMESLADCALRCLSCARCEYISYSAPLDDCSWYRTCDLQKLKTSVQGSWSFRSVPVRSHGDNASAFWEAQRTGRKGRGCPNVRRVTRGDEDVVDALSDIGDQMRKLAREPQPAHAPRLDKPLLLFGILSGGEVRRDHARCTWLRIDSGGAMRHLFVVGRGAKDRGNPDVLEVAVDEGRHLTGQGKGEVVAARTLSGYLKMVHFAKYAVTQPEELIAMGDDDIFLQPRMLAAYARMLHQSLQKSPALYAGVFEYFSWRTYYPPHSNPPSQRA